MNPFSLASPPANVHATPSIARPPAWTHPDLLPLIISMRNDICPIVGDGPQHHGRRHHVEFYSVPPMVRRHLVGFVHSNNPSLIVPIESQRYASLQVFLQHHTIRTSSSHIRSTPLSYTGHGPMQNGARRAPLPWAVSSRYFSGARSVAFTMSRCQHQHQARIL